MSNILNISQTNTRKRVITTENLFKGSGVFLILFGLIYSLVQFIHPDSQVENIHTTMWMVTSLLSLLMSLFAVIGLLGLYLRQVEKSGWLGLLGFTLFALFWLLSLTFAFIELYVLPVIVDSSPGFVGGMMSLFDGVESSAELGVFPFIATNAGVLYIGGGILLGIATLRAKVFSKPPAILLALSAITTILASVVPYPLNRVFALPLAISLMWLGAQQFKLKSKKSS